MTKNTSRRPMNQSQQKIQALTPERSTLKIIAAAKILIKQLDNRLFYAIFVSTLSLLASLKKMTYMTNDDVGMRFIIQGLNFFPPEPSEYVLFLNIMYSRFLKLLYEKFPYIYWYDLFFFTFIFISSLVIAYFLFIKNEKIFLKTLITLTIFICVEFTFNQLQFTMVAGITACSALIAAIRVFFYESTKPQLIFCLIYLPIAFFISAQVRIEMTCLCILLASLFSLLLVNKNIATRKNAAIVLSALTAIALIFIAQNYHKQEYAETNLPFNPLEFNKIANILVHGGILSYIEPEEKDELFKKAEPIIQAEGWNLNDLRLFNGFGGVATGIFDYEHVSAIAQKLETLFNGTAFHRVKYFFGHLLENGRYLHTTIFFLLFFIGRRVNIKRAIMAHIIVVSLCFICLFFMRPFPLRVYFMLNFLEIFFILLMVSNDINLNNCTKRLKRSKDHITNAIKTNRSLNKYITPSFLYCRGKFYSWIRENLYISKKLLSLLVSVPLLYSILSAYPIPATHVNKIRSAYEHLEIPTEPGIIFVAFNDYHGNALLRPFKPPKQNYHQLTFGLGWAVYTPAFHKKLAYNNFYEKLATGGIKLLIHSNICDTVNLLYPDRQQFIRDHYDPAFDMCSNIYMALPARYQKGDTL